MKRISIAVLLCIVCMQSIYAQKRKLNEVNPVDKLVLQIPDSLTKTTEDIANYIVSNFDNDKDKIRAIYAWVTTNIAYDVDNMFKVDIHEKKEDKITKALKTRKGVCDHYSLLFSEICSHAGIKSYVITGYVKLNGNIDNMSHAWCSAFIGDDWYLFDPTWGAGTVNNGKFTKKMNDAYFMVTPVTMIKSHMPFDYLWQFLDNTVTSNDFYQGNFQDKQDSPYFNYADSIKVYEAQPKADRLNSVAYRVEKNGVKNMVTADFLRNIKVEIENIKQTYLADGFNAAMADFNKGVKCLNDFINYRNNKFTPQKTDAEILEMIETPMETLNEVKSTLSGLKDMDTNKILPAAESIAEVDRALEAVRENKEWLDTYLKKGKLARKGMFHKVSWFGIPLN